MKDNILVYLYYNRFMIINKNHHVMSIPKKNYLELSFSKHKN